MMFEFLALHPLLLLALLLLIGSVLGQLKVAHAHLGSAAVLFVAIGLTAWAKTQGVELSIPEILGNFGLVLFTYTVGITSGPNFFGSLRRGWPVMLSTVCCIALAAVVAGVLGFALGLPSPVIAGTYAGALTNTPALAAAGQVSGQAELAAVGYSISYLWGVVGMLLAAAWALRRGERDRAEVAHRLEQRTVRVDIADSLSVGDLVGSHHGSVAMTRIKHGQGPIMVAVPEERISKGDLVSVIGEPELLAELTAELGHASSVDIIGDRSQLDSIRVTLSEPWMAGRTVDELELMERFGAQVSRVRRGDVDMIPTNDFVVQMGDRLRVVGPWEQMFPIRDYLGDSERGFADINPLGLAFGLAVGVLVGMIPVPLPSGTFSLGSAAGTLITGLVFGWRGRLGRVPIAMPTAAAHSLSALGMLVFLAYAGTKAGPLFAEALTSSMGWKVALLGFVITIVAAGSLLVAGRLQRSDWVQLSGQRAGAQTQPAVLAFANTRTGFDTRVSLGYVLVYPAAMVGKILITQILALVG